MRKLYRAMAHANMARVGIQNPNKERHDPQSGLRIGSKFAVHWCEYATTPAVIHKACIKDLEERASHRARQNQKRAEKRADAGVV